MPKHTRRRPRSLSSAAEQSHNEFANEKQPRRPITVYDAVAGRVSTHGFIPPIPRTSKHCDTIASHQKPVPPEDVLFRRRHAPERYEEDNFYFSHQNLTEGQELPDSDMLKAVHIYASDFYRTALRHEGVVDFRSMDETALMCMGILLEEYAQSILGETGDLVLVEPGEEKEDRSAAIGANSGRRMGVAEKGKGPMDIGMTLGRESDDEGSTENAVDDESENDGSSSSESEEVGFQRPRSIHSRRKESSQTDTANERETEQEESSEDASEVEDEDGNSSSSESESPGSKRARKRIRAELR